MKYDLAVLIGRFQPFHLGHAAVVNAALNVAQRVLVLIGSSYEPRSLRNPWSFEEREKMLREAYGEADNARILCEPLLDSRYNDTLWATQVQKVVYDIHGEGDEGVVLIGCPGKGAGYYVSLFPQWNNVTIDREPVRTGTEIRNALFQEKKSDELDQDVPPATREFLDRFISSPSGQDLKREHEFIDLYKKGWEGAPFTPTHVTVDAVVVQSGHVLLVRRGARPGKGLMALPGGFIRPEETLAEAMVRKLKEETQIKVPTPALMGSVKSQAVFDAPYRSDRGRTITHAFYMELRGEEALPKIKSGGQSSHCLWLPLGQLDSSQMYEDHYFIIQKMTGVF